MPHAGEPYGLCADRFAVNKENVAFSISDGVGNSLFPELWAKLICDDFVNHRRSDDTSEKNPIREEQLIEKWEGLRDKIVESFDDDQKFIYEMGLAKADYAAATMVGLDITQNLWKCWALGDSYLAILDSNYNILKTVSSMSGQPFGCYPEYFASKIGYNNGNVSFEKDIIEGKKYFVLMTDALSEWFLSTDRTKDEIEQLINVESHDDFCRFVEEMRQCQKMNDDDTTVVILTIDESEIDKEIKVVKLAVDNIDELICSEKSEEGV